METETENNGSSQQPDLDKVKCYRLFRPDISEVKTSFFAQIP